MRIEIRTDGTHISGYVNATEKKSRPLMTPRGKVIEEIEPRSFEQALERAGNVTLEVDHDAGHIYAQTSDGTLTLYEDGIGLHADVVVVDPWLIELAKAGKIKGWSFGMYNVVDEMEARAEGLPLRHVKGLDLDHVSLVVNKNPAYSATSVEVRADDGDGRVLELRADDIDTHITLEDLTGGAGSKKPEYDNSAYLARAAALRR